MEKGVTNTGRRGSQDPEQRGRNEKELKPPQREASDINVDELYQSLNRHTGKDCTLFML